MTIEQPAALRIDARRLAIVRLGIGFVQGLALYLLYRAYDAQVWPATQGAVFAPLLLLSLYLPLLLSQGFGNIRTRTLIVWAAIAAAAIAGLGWYDIWRAWPVVSRWINGVRWDGPPLIPSFALMLFGAIALFIAQALVTGGDMERRYRARYETYFDTAWKFGTQLALSAAFVGAFWLLLWLGSELFLLIGLHFLETLIGHEWFSIPVTTLAVAMAVHVTDVRAGLVRGARTLALVLLSWLLPLMALFAVVFLIALPMTGLEPLWQTKSAASLLLTSAGVLVILINAAYQDGINEHHAVPLVLQLAARAAAIALVPITLLAAYAIYLRVHQYGWTVDRVSSVAVALVALGYAGGYAWAAARPGVWMEVLRTWNFAMAIVVLAVLMALFTPLADPARISVSSQMARLARGSIAAEQFDFAFLRYQGERFGFAALTDLKRHAAGPKAAFERKSVAALLNDQPVAIPADAPSAGGIAANVRVYPQGRSLPASLLRQKWVWADNVPGCLLYRGQTCSAFLIDLDGDGHDEIVFAAGDGHYLGSAQVFAVDPAGKWGPVATIAEPRCNGALIAMRAGKIAAVAAIPRWRDIDAGGIRLHLTPLDQTDTAPCPR